MGDDARTQPIGRSVWGDTRLILPDSSPFGRWRNLLTDTTAEVHSVDGRPTLALAELFDVLPVGLLVEDGS